MDGKAGGKTLMTMPKAALVRAILMNHTFHHRGQLSVYLRLLDVPVPSIYGPSADENPFTDHGALRRKAVTVPSSFTSRFVVACIAAVWAWRGLWPRSVSHSAASRSRSHPIARTGPISQASR